jgi:hypothetical protein
MHQSEPEAEDEANVIGHSSMSFGLCKSPINRTHIVIERVPKRDFFFEHLEENNIIYILFSSHHIYYIYYYCYYLYSFLYVIVKLSND